MEQEYKRAQIVYDEDDHVYLIPYDSLERFYNRLIDCQKAEDFIGGVESEEEYQEKLNIYNSKLYTYSDFEKEFGDYRVEGDYEIYAKF